jgi:hypothetical protein
MLWNVAAPFFVPDAGATTRWIDDFVPAGAHRFHKVPFPTADSAGWHNRTSRGTPLAGWLRYWKAGGAAARNADGVITVFPQLAVTTAIHRQLHARRGMPIVAWCFNLGQLGGGAKQIAARTALGNVERFVVHSSAEVELIATYLDVPTERVRFVPLQRAPIAAQADEDLASPFIVAMGSANRDYRTLIAAARDIGLPVTIVASPRVLAGIELPANVTVRSGLSANECHVLAQRARFSVVPLADMGVASGQVTVIEAQCMHRAVIATRSIGTADYIRDGKTGVLVDAGSVVALGDAMQALWRDRQARERIAKGGLDFALEELSDQAAGRYLGAILDEIADQRS